MLPLRMDPVAGAFLGTILLFGGLLIGPVALVLAMIAWIVIRAGGESSTSRKPDLNRQEGTHYASGSDPVFAARFREMEDGILRAKRGDIGES